MNRALLISCGLALGAWAAPAQAQTNIAPQAERVLSAACQYLAGAPYFSLNAEVWRKHVTASGQKLQFSRTVSMEVKRPNRLHLEIASPHSQRGFWYDGKSLTILDRQPGLFSMAAMPGTLDAALDKAHDQFGIDLPLVDLAVGVLPPAYVQVSVGGTDYYYYDGVYFQPTTAGSYAVVAPPVGVIVPQLPDGAEAIAVGPMTYYYVGGAFYLQQPTGFAVVPAPLGVTVTGLPPGAAPVTINGAIYYVAGSTYFLPVMQAGVTVYVTARP